MAIIRNTLIGVLVISLITFVALFGRLPALRKTPIGWLQRLLCLHLPNTLKTIDRKATGGKLSVKGKKLGHYLFFQKNPIVLVSLSKPLTIRLDVHTILRSSTYSSSPGVPFSSSTTVLSGCQHHCYYQPQC
jgi:hypothetical protein